MRGCWLVEYTLSLVTEAEVITLELFFMLSFMLSFSLLALLSEAVYLLDALFAVAAAAEATADDAQLNTMFDFSRSLCFALLLSISL